MELPRRFEVRIDNAIHHNKMALRRAHKPVLISYQNHGGTMQSKLTRFVWMDDMSINSFIITTWMDKDDWTKLRYNILAHDPSVEVWIKPIMDEYVADMYEYYHVDDEDNDDDELRKAKKDLKARGIQLVL
jgi:hypothetical protein